MSRTPEKNKREPIGDKTAGQVRVVSRVNRPIGKMTFYERSLLFAEISLISYMEPIQCTTVAKRMGFVSGKFYNRHALFTSLSGVPLLVLGLEMMRRGFPFWGSGAMMAMAAVFFA
jgi:hypothetical protein